MESATQSRALKSDVVLALRGQRSDRPAIDPFLAGGLRSWLEDDLSKCAESLSPETPFVLTPRSTTSQALVAVPTMLALARGALVSVLAAQRIALGEVRHPMDDALSALEADPYQHDVVEAIHALDQDAFAQLAAEVSAHDDVLRRHLSLVPTTWFPRSNVKLTAPLAGGRLLLTARVNVVLGTPSQSVASVCFLDLTTSLLDDQVLRRLGVLSLIETLRSGAPPLRVASLSTATGDVAMLEVTDDVLAEAVTDVVTAAHQRGEQS